MTFYCFNHSDIVTKIKLMASGYYSAEFHPKRKKLKGYQKKKK